MQTMSRESGGGGGDPVRTPQSTHSVHVGNSEPGLPSLQLLQSLSEENTLGSKQKERRRRGRSCAKKGRTASPQGHPIPVKGYRGRALGARAQGDGDGRKDEREAPDRCRHRGIPNGRRGT